MENYNEILKQQTDAFFANDENQNVIWKKWKNVKIDITKEQAIHCEKICHENIDDLDASDKMIEEYLNNKL